MQVKPEDIPHMRRALDLAWRVRGKTLPNPAVGALLVQGTKVVGEGSTQPAGGNHAEIQAILQAGEKTRGATLYVTLEPCSHYGKTPPCSLAVRDAGVSRVVVGKKDPNPIVAGRGIKFLENAGIEVCLEESVELADEIEEFYAGFSSFILKARPRVILKIAVSADGFIAGPQGERRKISGEESALWTHELRSASDAILVSGRSARNDNPSLDARKSLRRKNPVRVLLWNSVEPSSKLRLFRASEEILVFGPREIASVMQNCHFFLSEADSLDENLENLLDVLGRRGLHQLMVEPGSELLGGFLRSGCWDRLFVLRSPVLLRAGIPWDLHLPESWVAKGELSRFARAGKDEILVAERDFGNRSS